MLAVRAMTETVLVARDVVEMPTPSTALGSEISVLLPTPLFSKEIPKVTGFFLCMFVIYLFFIGGVAGAVASMFEVLRVAAGRIICGMRNNESSSPIREQWRKYLGLFDKEVHRNNYWWGEDITKEKDDEAVVNEINKYGLGEYLHGNQKKSGVGSSSKPETLAAVSSSTEGKELELAALQLQLFNLLFDQLSPYNPLNNDLPLNKKSSPLQNVPSLSKEFSDAFQAKVFFDL
jgi:hypothetical protein